MRCFAECLSLPFNRIQFTPDLMPSDILGTEILQENKSTGHRELVFIKPEKAVDLQLGYEFNTGMYKGLSLLLQVNNLTDAPYARYTDSPDIPKEYNTYGRTMLFGVNYKF